MEDSLFAIPAVQPTTRPSASEDELAKMIVALGSLLSRCVEMAGSLLLEHPEAKAKSGLGALKLRQSSANLCAMGDGEALIDLTGHLINRSSHRSHLLQQSTCA